VRQLLTTPIRVGRHLAIWLVWQSTGATLVGNDRVRSKREWRS
jgi:hypothetical protein